VGRDTTAKAAWTVVLLLSSLLIGNPFVLVLLLPVLVAFWLLSHSTHLAGGLLTLAHVCLAVVVVTADAPDENRAFAPVTVLVVDVLALAGCALVAPVFRRWRGPPTRTG
jgi:hypothetical protein